MNERLPGMNPTAIPVNRRLRYATLAIVLAMGVAGCGGGSDSSEDASSSPPSGERLRLGAPLPAIELRDLDGGAANAALTPGPWRVLILNPKLCVSCDEQYPDWVLPTRIWNEMGLDVVVVAEREPARLSGIVGGQSFDFGPYVTESSLFRVTTTLDRSVIVLVDPAGVVRYRGRGRGTFEEQVMGVQRNYHYLSSGPEVREEALRKAAPDAARIELKSSLETEWLGESACDLGLSPWFGEIFDADQQPAGWVFPIERETGCNTCDPLYLAAAVSTGGEILDLVAIEPIISGGQHIRPTAFFRRFRGIRSPRAMREIAPFTFSEPANQATREIVRVALSLADRARP